MLFREKREAFAADFVDQLQGQIQPIPDDMRQGTVPWTVAQVFLLELSKAAHSGLMPYGLFMLLAELARLL